MNSVTADLVGKLRALLAPDRVLMADVDILPYSFDGTAALKQKPGAVVFPLTPEEVAACVGAAREAAVPVVTRGSG
ncbi:MAG TPA: glycolate oxidase subunit GlcD, partial [Prosthecobacter sp.]|nr:glycolate oxidase subunit GlcD [Prosthecobacter sp.]